jgi:hypothetical protein
MKNLRKVEKNLIQHMRVKRREKESKWNGQSYVPF